MEEFDAVTGMMGAKAFMRGYFREGEVYVKVGIGFSDKQGRYVVARANEVAAAMTAEEARKLADILQAAFDFNTEPEAETDDLIANLPMLADSLREAADKLEENH